MGCPNAVKLADFSAGRLDEPSRARVEGHLRECAACRTANARIGTSLATLREIAGAPVPTPTSVSAARIEAALRWSRPYPALPLMQRLFGERPWAVAALAAAALAAGFVGWQAWRRPAPSQEIAVRPPAPVAPRPVALAPQQTALQAVVTLVGGDARLGRGAAAGALDPLARLAAGDALSTQAGARVGIQWDDGSGALVGQASEVRLARLEARTQDLELRRGRVSVRVGKHKPGELLQVTAPDHVVTVHGTWFNVIGEANGTTVEVLEGVVEVSARDGDRSSTRLAAPQRAFFPRGAGVGEGARTLSGAEAEKLRALSDMALLAWTSVDELLGSTGVLDVAPNPAASVAIDGVSFGTSPLLLRHPRGRHLVELSRPGFATVRRWISVGAEPGVLRGDLQAEVSRPSLPATPPEPEEVRLMVAARRRAIEACYERGLKHDESLGGTVTLQVQLGPEGQVLGTSVEENALGDPEVVKCLRREVGAWTFRNARNATFSYPFRFRAP